MGGGPPPMPQQTPGAPGQSRGVGFQPWLRCHRISEGAEMMNASPEKTAPRAAARRFPRRRSVLVALAAVGMVGLSVLVAGCGGSPGAGVAQIATNKTSTTG